MATNHPTMSNSDSEGDSEAEQTPAEELGDEGIVQLASSQAAVKVLCVLVDAGGDPLGGGDIREQADISEWSWHETVMPLLLPPDQVKSDKDGPALGLIERHDSVGATDRYRARIDTDRVQAFIQLRDALLEDVQVDQ